MAVYGVESQNEAVSKQAKQKQDSANARQKERYSSDPIYRMSLRQRHRESVLKKSVSYRSRAHLGLVTEEERNKRKEEQLKRKYAARRSKRSEMAAERSAKRATINGIPVTFYRIKQEIAKLSKAVSSLSEKLDRESSFAEMKLASKDVNRKRKAWQVKSNNRRARIASAQGAGISRDEWFSIMRSWSYCCAYCGRSRSDVRNANRRMDLEIEHVIPMPIGKNDASNIVPACKHCNSSKSDSDLIEWADKKGIHLDDRVIDIYRAGMHA
jgi:5-methylcytosine-specific restriction endonuclease McrA